MEKYILNTNTNLDDLSENIELKEFSDLSSIRKRKEDHKFKSQTKLPKMDSTSEFESVSQGRLLYNYFTCKSNSIPFVFKEKPWLEESQLISKTSEDLALEDMNEFELWLDITHKSVNSYNEIDKVLSSIRTKSSSIIASVASFISDENNLFSPISSLESKHIIDTIPVELLTYIFSMVDISQIISAPQVCKKWRFAFKKRILQEISLHLQSNVIHSTSQKSLLLLSLASSELLLSNNLITGNSGNASGNTVADCDPKCLIKIEKLKKFLGEDQIRKLKLTMNQSHNLIYESLSQLIPNIQTLNLTINNEINISPLFSHCSLLTELSLKIPSKSLNEMIENLPSNCPLLTSLSLNCKLCDEKSSFFWNFLRNFQFLKNLDLRLQSSYKLKIALLLNKLEKLRISDHRIIVTEYSLPNIQSIEIHSTTTPEISLTQIAMTSRYLKRLLIFGGNFDCDEITTLMIHCPYISTLHISGQLSRHQLLGHPSLTNLSIGTSQSNLRCPQLKELYLTEPILSNALWEIIDSCPLLTSLSFYSPDGSDNLIDFIYKKCPNIHRLKIYYPNMTDETLYLLNNFKQLHYLTIGKPRFLNNLIDSTHFSFWGLSNFIDSHALFVFHFYLPRQKSLEFLKFLPQTVPSITFKVSPYIAETSQFKCKFYKFKITNHKPFVIF